MELDFKGVPNECVWGDGGGGVGVCKGLVCVNVGNVQYV